MVRPTARCAEQDIKEVYGTVSGDAAHQDTPKFMFGKAYCNACGQELEREGAEYLCTAVSCGRRYDVPPPIIMRERGAKPLFEMDHWSAPIHIGDEHSGIIVSFNRDRRNIRLIGWNGGKGRVRHHTLDLADFLRRIEVWADELKGIRAQMESDETWDVLWEFHSKEFLDFLNLPEDGTPQEDSDSITK